MLLQVSSSILYSNVRTYSETGTEIHQYVGDEFVLTWKLKEGLDDSNCNRLFFLIEDQIQAHRNYFLKEYGVVQEFITGLHA